ncbi:MAG: hypothetical protein ABIE94_04995 [archaeon]
MGIEIPIEEDESRYVLRLDGSIKDTTLADVRTYIVEMLEQCSDKPFVVDVSSLPLGFGNNAEYRERLMIALLALNRDHSLLRIEGHREVLDHIVSSSRVCHVAEDSAGVYVAYQ